MTNQDINATYNTHRFFLTPSLMVAPCREFANIPISKSQNPCHEPSNQYTNQPLTEINAGDNPPGNPPTHLFP